MFFVPRKPKKHGIYDVLFASGDKNHGIYNVFGPGQAKTLVFIYAVLSMLQEVLCPCQRHKNTVKYSVLGLLLGFVEGAEAGGS